MNERAVVFRCGGDELVALLHCARAESPQVGVLIVVGGPQYRVGSHRQFVLMARRLAEHGTPVFRFDYRGMGDSDGEPRTFESVDDDIRSAVDKFVDVVPTLRRIVLLGLCDAASAVSMYVPTDQRVGGLILINPWVRTEASEAATVLRHHYASRLRELAFWRRLLTGDVRIAQAVTGLLGSIRTNLGMGARGGGENVPRRFIDRMLHGLESYSGPVLVVLSDDDLTAREFESLCRNSDKWRNATARPGVRTRRLVGADHTFSSATALGEATAAISEWVDHWRAPDCELGPSPVGRT